MNICKIEKTKSKIVMYNSEISKNIKLCRSLFRVGVGNIDFRNINSVNLVVFSISRYFSLYGDIRCLQLIKDIITNNSLDIEAKIYLYWQLVRVNFINEEARKSIELEQIYNHIIEAIKKEKYIKIPEKNIDEAKNEKIAVFITNQFTVNEHSPTKVLLTIAKSINDKFKDIKKIYIFNSREMPTEGKYFYYNPLIANYIEDYSNEVLSYVLEEEKIDRCKVYYKQGISNDKILNRIETMLDKVVKLNPKIIISIGGSSILADLCNEFTDTYTVGISGEVPISKCKYLVNTDNVKTIIKNKLSENQYYMNLPISMSDISINSSNEGKYTRAELGISKGLFLISIVGNRLMAEVKREFLDLCIDILKDNNSCGLIFIGNFNKEIIKPIVDSEIYNRIYNIKYANNLVSAIELSDLYLNPIRNGGGLSGIAAIKSSIPVVSTNIGDISIYLSDEFKVRNYEEMKKLVNSIIKNKDIYEDLKNKTKELYNNYSKSSWELFIEYIINN